MGFWHLTNRSKKAHENLISFLLHFQWLVNRRFSSFFATDDDPQYVSRLQIMQKIQNDWVERGRKKIFNAQTLTEDVITYFRLGGNAQYQIPLRSSRFCLGW